MTRSSLAAGATVALVALACSQSGLASTVTYEDDRAGFLAATGASSIGSLPVTPSLSGANNVAVGPVTFGQVSGSPLWFFNFSNELSGADLGMSGPENFDMSIAAGVYSIGFYVHQPTYNGTNDDQHPGAWGCNSTCDDSTFSIELLAGTTSLGVFTYAPPKDSSGALNGAAVLGFFGVQSSVAFDKVRVRDVTNTVDNEYFGGFVVGRTALVESSVPEPSSYALAALALGVLGITAQRRKAALP